MHGVRSRPCRDGRGIGLLPDGGGPSERHDMSAPPRRLRARGETLELGPRPWLMGIVNATPDSFSDAGLAPTLSARLELAADLIACGAEIIDVGGESGVTNRPAVAADEEIARVVPVIERVRAELGARVSVDTYKPAVARAAIAAGASIINDVSGLRDPELADVCAEGGAALVIMHTRAVPKQKLLDRSYDGRIVADVERFLSERIELALARGVSFEQLLLDPGPDFSKTPAQTVEVLRDLDRRGRGAVPERADRARARTGRVLRAAAARPWSGLFEDAGADGRGAARPFAAARARAPATARGLPQGLRRRDHAAPAPGTAGGHARGDRAWARRRCARAARPRRRRGRGLHRRPRGARRRGACRSRAAPARSVALGDAAVTTGGDENMAFPPRRRSEK